MSIDENHSSLHGKSEHLNYDELVPTQCNLAEIKFTNDYEKTLITRIYSTVSNLCSYISDYSSANLKFYLNQPDKYDFMPLYYAVKANNLTTVKYLLKIGSSFQKTTKQGDPAAHLACLIGCSTEMIDYLLSFNKDIYACDQDGWTVLHCACNQGHLHLVEYLIEKKFMNMNCKDSVTKLTGLQLAAIHDRFNIISYLLNFNSSSVVKNTLNDENIFTSNRPKSSKIVSKLCAQNLETLNENLTKNAYKQL